MRSYTRSVHTLPSSVIDSHIARLEVESSHMHILSKETNNTRVRI